MTTKYPSELDTDAELPRVDDAVTEVGGQAIDALRQAMLAVQAAIGTNPQGTTASLVNRLAVSFNDNGTFKASALVAAGLVALPITNAMIGASAGIEESKLDLDFATEVLQSQISSNDVDILALQESFTSIINDFNQHVAGTAFQHSSFHILLGAVLPGIAGTTVGAALTEINSDIISHASTSTVAAHQAGNIATSGTYGGQSVTTVQQALEALDDAVGVELVKHRDDHHSNGISNWANYPGGYNSNHQIVPTTLAATVSALIVAGTRNIIDFISLDLASLKVKQGNVVVIQDTLSAGQYIVDDIGPRNPVGAKPLLTSSQLEIVGTLPDDGYATMQIFAQSSLQQFKTNLAPTIHQSDIRVDSIQLARPDAARVLSLGFNPNFVTGSSTLALQLGVGTALTRSITVNNLHLDRNGAAASPVTLDTVIGRINHVFQNRVDGNAIPAAAYRVGDELMIAHNWNDSSAYYLSVLSSGAGNFELGFDGYGANILDELVRPSQNSKYYVAGEELNDVGQILETTATIAGQIFTLNGVNPLEEGVKVGHLLHLKSHATTSQIGTYFIISVDSTSVTVHKTAGVTAASNVPVEIWHDAIPLEDFNAGGGGSDRLMNVFVDHLGRTSYNQRLEYTDNISGLAVVDISDNFLAGEHTIFSSISGTALSLRLISEGVSGPTLTLPTSISGKFKLYSQSNIEWITLELTSPVSANTNDLIVYDQIDEEELLEICTVRFNGITAASNIVDKRLFGSVGLDEIREDYTQAYIETPLYELRSSGVVYGFDILEDNYQDTSIFGASDFGVLLRGGVAYVSGVRLDVPTAPVMIPQTAGTYYVGVGITGQFFLLNNADYTLEQILDGYAGDQALVAKVVHSGGGSDPLISTDLRKFVNNLDEKVELLLDTTNRRIGTFASADAALSHVASYPHGERFRINVVSITQDNISIPTGMSNIVLQIDGAVGSVTVGSNCRIVGTQPLERSIPHIRGSLTVASTCTEFHMDHISVGGAATIGNTSVDATARLSYCRFASSLTINTSNTQVTNCHQLSTAVTLNIPDTSGDTLISGCRFAGPRLTIASATAAITDSIFTGSAGFLTTTATRTVVENCVFDGTAGAGSGAISAIGNSTFANCLFKSITHSAGTVFGVNSSTAFVSISSSVFQAILMTGTGSIATLTSGTLKISDCDFDSACTFTTNATVVCTDFESNRCATPAAPSNFLVRLLGTGRFAKNRGVHAVTTGTSASDGPVIISENIFPACTLGYNVDVSQAPTTASSQCIITSNIFSSVQNDGILCGANTVNAMILGNLFDGPGTGINFGTGTTYPFVENNSLLCTTSISSTGVVSFAHFSNNFLGSGSLQIASTVIFTGNHAVDLTISGTTVNSFIMTGNYFGNLTLSTAITGGNISDNRFSVFTVANSISNTSIHDNEFAGPVAVSGVPIMESVRLANNWFDDSMAGWDTLIWENSTLCGNTYDAANNFTIVCRDGNRFSDNILVGANTITFTAAAAGIITKLICNQNITLAGTLSFPSSLSRATIDGNLDTNIVVDGMNKCSISNNIGNTNDIAINGSTIDCLVCNNAMSNIKFFTTQKTHSASKCVISGNKLGANIIVGDTTGIASSFTYTFQDNQICKNNCSSILLFGSTVNPTGATIVLEDCVIEGNTATGLTILRPTVGYTYSGGQIIGGLYICGNFLSAVELQEPEGVSVQWKNILISGNQVSTTLNVGQIDTSVMNSVNISNNFSIDCEFALEAAGIFNFIMTHNIFERIRLPSNESGAGSVWTGSHSKITYNYANFWSLAQSGTGTFISAGIPISSFVLLGNTGTSTSSITFSGATNRTTANTNDLNGDGAEVN